MLYFRLKIGCLGEIALPFNLFFDNCYWLKGKGNRMLSFVPILPHIEKLWTTDSLKRDATLL